MNEVANSWVVQAPKPKFVAVPTGNYNAVFVGMEGVQLQPGVKKNGQPDDGKRKRFTWKVTTGPLAGQLATALVSLDLNQNTHAGRLISGLLGRALVNGEDVNAAILTCIDKTYMVSVQNGPKGGQPQVQSVGLPPAM